MAMAPLSLVQAVIAGGLVLIAFPAQRYFGHRLNPREWLGLGLAAAGLAFLAFTVPHAHESEGYSIATLAGFETVMVGTRRLPLRLRRSAPRLHDLPRRRPRPRLGNADRRLQRRDQGPHRGDRRRRDDRPAQPLDRCSPSSAVLGAFFALARGMQLGKAIPVIATASAASNCAAILGGVVVFGDPIGSGAVDGLARGLAFAAVIAAAALMPGPGDNAARA